jgi:predicted nucleotidyltransferase
MSPIAQSVTPATLVLRSRLEQLREQIQTIAAQYSISQIRVFGSVARGEATDESDIDLLVAMEPERSLLDRIGCIQDLSDLLIY